MRHLYTGTQAFAYEGRGFRILRSGDIECDDEKTEAAITAFLQEAGILPQPEPAVHETIHVPDRLVEDLKEEPGTDLGVMDRDSKKMRGSRPFLFTNLMKKEGVPEIIAWIRHNVLLEDSQGPHDGKDGR